MGKWLKHAVSGLWINEVGLSGKNVSMSPTPGAATTPRHRYEQERPILSTGLSTDVDKQRRTGRLRMRAGRGWSRFSPLLLCRSHAVGEPVGKPTPMSQGVPGE